jgi:hypothetical protein
MPAITKPSNHFDVRARAGNGVSPSAVVTDLNFTPNLIWTKQRDAINYHVITDDISRSNIAAYLSSNATDSENTASSGGWYQSFNTNGYTTRAGSSDSANVNKSGLTYVDWVWKGGGTAVTNTSGTITSQVSVNSTAGFSIVSYAGTVFYPQTIGHGLGVVPQFIIVKNRQRATNWAVYHVSVGNTKALYLNATDAAYADAGFWNNTSPSSTVFTGDNGVGYTTNGAAENYVAYCWTPIAGYSAFGSYTGNGSADGPFIYTGFRPRFILTKSSSLAGGNWLIQDTARGTYNAVGNSGSPNSPLVANSSGTETNWNGAFSMDILSNGFKMRTTAASLNQSAETYVYAAFAEAPFKYAGAR